MFTKKKSLARIARLRSKESPATMADAAAGEEEEVVAAVEEEEGAVLTVEEVVEQQQQQQQQHLPVPAMRKESSGE